MINGIRGIYNDYEKLLVKNDKLSKENRKLGYLNTLLENQNRTLEKENEKISIEVEQKQELIKELEYENARLKALLNMSGTNHGIPTSQTPIHKTKVIPNTREKTDLPKGGQKGHQKHKLEKFKDEEVTETIEHKVKSKASNNREITLCFSIVLVLFIFEL